MKNVKKSLLTLTNGLKSSTEKKNFWPWLRKKTSLKIDWDGECMVVCCTVKNIHGIPVFFFTKPFRNGKSPVLTRDFLVPSREGIFCLLRREKYSSFCRGNFFLSVECYISLFPLFPIKFTGKLLEDSWLATGAPGRVAIKFGRWEKNSAPFVKFKCEIQWNSS